ncbi:hypothetical protein RND81_08G071500 [Saponaria officinalis]|uniref:Reverse transcriptase domain-containing protein n=1 Tax=Saponaria officinalis TaxID=3572 RepID=A0AAW1J3M5_SAPOF
MALNHLCFADDALLFCRGDKAFVWWMLRAFSTFTKPSGLRMSPTKSYIYFNGVPTAVISDIVQRSGLQLGTLPFRYLGVPISPKKLSVLECELLTDKIVARIRSWGAKKLSYAGRVVLIKAILTQLHTYWARIFILPMVVIKRIDAICSAYLWSGHEHYEKAPNVAWDRVCRSQQHGGLGILNLKAWNIANIGKFGWWLAKKEDHLWIRWIHGTYLKGQDWNTYSPSFNSSSTWKGICRAWDQLRAGCVGSWWLTRNKEYTVAAGYDWLMQGLTVANWRAFV